MAAVTGKPGTPAAARPRRGLSIAVLSSLVLGLIGLVASWFILALPSILAVLLGIVGLHRTREGGLRGRPMAVTGLVLGVAVTVAVAGFFADLLVLDLSS